MEGTQGTAKRPVWLEEGECGEGVVAMNSKSKWEPDF